jgi:hypothetical protein
MFSEFKKHCIKPDLGLYQDLLDHLPSKTKALLDHHQNSAVVRHVGGKWCRACRKRCVQQLQRILKRVVNAIHGQSRITYRELSECRGQDNINLGIVPYAQTTIELDRTA